MTHDAVSNHSTGCGLWKAIAAIGAVLVWLSCGGCAGGAKVELAAADAIEQLSHSVSLTLEAYHADLVRLDAFREQSAARAFAARLRASENVVSAESDEAAFLEALEKIRADRDTAWQRYAAAMNNVSALGEIARGLRRLAIDTMSLNDEARRYFDELLALWPSSRDALDAG